MHSFKSLIFIRFCHFSVAHNTKNFALHFCMLAGYNIDYVHIFFFKKLVKKFYKIFQNEGINEARKTKTPFLINVY
jgi:hypothetical protein